MIGYCRFCGQGADVDTDEMEKANELATEHCTCARADDERRVKRQVMAAQVRAIDLFNEECGRFGFAGAAAIETREIICLLVEEIARRNIQSVKLDLGELGKCQIGITGKGKIKVTRTQGRTYTAEE